MSSLIDEAYINLCNEFRERATHARLAFTDLDEEDEFDDNIDDAIPNCLHFNFINGQGDSELMWVPEEQCLYISNGKIVSSNAEAYTCYQKKCKGRIYLTAKGLAYKVAEHNVNHGSMYKEYAEKQCRSFMKEQCETAGSSKTISDIYEEAVMM